MDTNTTEYWIENTYERSHLGKCLWCPNYNSGKGAGWLYPSDMKVNDVVIHHFTGDDPDIGKGFIGISWVSAKEIDIPKSKLEARLQSIDAWDEKNRTKRYWKNYDKFNIVILRDFKKLPRPIPTEEAYKKIGNSPNFENKVFSEGKKKRGEITQMYLRRVNADFFENLQVIADIQPATFESLAKQIILYGPPGTGKTFRARKIAVQLIEKKKIMG